MPRLYKNVPKVVMTKQDKHNMIVDAALSQKFGDKIEDIDLLSYTDKSGQVREDRFNYINAATIPITVQFIGGTGYDDFSVPLNQLTVESMDKLVACIAE